MNSARDLDDYDVVWNLLGAREGESLHNAATRVREENWRGIKRKVAKMISDSARVHPGGSWEAVKQAAELVRQKGQP